MSPRGLRKWFYLSAVVLLATLSVGAFAQTEPAAQADGQDTQTSSEPDLLKRKVDAKTQQKQAEKLKTELGKTYKRWLNEDVAYIITDEERDAFKRLSNDEERDAFIENFWLRRNPDPDSMENSFKEEHYRRIAYANERFAAGIPGWKTDRGRIYITFGKPDEITSHVGGQYQRTQEEGGGSTSTYPFEVWRYRYLEGADLGNQVEIEFVDTCMCGDFHMTYDRSEKDAFKTVPGMGLTQYEEMGISSKKDRIGTGLEELGPGTYAKTRDVKMFSRLAQYAALNRAPSLPEVKFKDLSEMVSHKIRINMLPFDVRFDYVKLTSETVLVPITVQVKNRDVTWSSKEGVQRMVVNIFGRVTTMTGRPAGTFEDTVEDRVPDDLLSRVMDNNHLYWKALPLKAGRYRLDLVLKDVNGDRVGTWSRGLVVPEFAEDKLASSSLILADQMEKVPAKNVGAGNFVIGDTKVRPRLDGATGKPASFKRGQRVNIWMQVYNLGKDQKTNKPSASIEYDIVNVATKKSVVHTVETTEELGNIGDQITVQKSLPVAGMEPGVYQLTIKVDDKLARQSITPTTRFTVE